MKEQDYTLEYTCERCGKHADLEKYDFEKPLALLMQQKHICHTCAFWELFFQNHREEYEIYNGEVYLYGKPMFFTQLHDIGVKSRYIIHPDRTVKLLNYSYSLGPLPVGINMPDTGIMISRQAYSKIYRRASFSCLAKGCYDRYHCYWYEAEKREATGPWNIVPKSHKIGGEYCKSFINRDFIFNTK